MYLSFKKIFFPITFNLSLFVLLIIGIQNSDSRSKVNFMINETVNLPISFIIGASFICGSLSGSFLCLNFNQENKLSS